MSQFQALGLSLHVFRPTHSYNATTGISTPSLEAEHVADLTSRVTDYQQSIAMDGGYLSASFSFPCRQEETEAWYEYGVGCFVRVTDDAGDTVWEGLVDQVAIAIGGVQINRGPLTDVGNVVYLTATTQDASTAPPSNSNQTLTTAVTDTASIALYGVRQQIINAEAVTAAQATQYTNLWLRENSYPKTTQSIDLSGGGEAPRVSFRCQGFWSMADYYYHNIANASGAITGAVNVNVKMAAILNYDRAGYFSSANASLATNATQVASYEGNWTEAQTLIRDLVNVSDTSYNRYLFMVGPERFITYAAVTSEISYYQTISEGRQTVRDANGMIVKPWNVQPGKWLRITDWMAAKDDPLTTYYGDSRYMLIEQVDYAMPWGLRLSGGRSDKMTQYLAQLGLKGK